MGKTGEDTKVPFNHIVKECVLAGEWGRATEAVKRMLHQGAGGKGIRFDSNTFNAVSAVSLAFYKGLAGLCCVGLPLIAAFGASFVLGCCRWFCGMNPIGRRSDVRLYLKKKKRAKF